MKEKYTDPGIILINKEAGWTSFDVVKKIRYKLKLNKLGHTGTLDPFATGLLILCANRATKLNQIFLELPKVYEATFSFGEEKDSHDITGKTTKKTTNFPKINQIENAIKDFTGLISQYPPKFSALKVNGKRAYTLARKGLEVKLKPRNINIYNYKVIDFDGKNLKVSIKCSSGTYIRSLARDLGRSLDSLAYVSKLRRTSIGNFNVKDAINTENINIKNIITLESSLCFLNDFQINKESINKVKNGVPFNLSFLKSQPKNSENLKSYFSLSDNEKNIKAILKDKKYIYISH